MYRIATDTEYVFDNRCLTYDEAVKVKNNLEKENPTCRLFIYKEQFIVYCNEAMCDKILLYNVNNYNPSQENNLTSYAMQFEEVDANAWGVYVIISLFHTRPLLENIYGEQVWQQILRRVEEIKADTII